jgi:ferritin-like metal-binding protein YciE
LEANGRLQKCRIYEMTSNKTARGTIAFLIARDAAHEAAFAKALESLGVNWGQTLPVPKFDATKYPEVKTLMDAGAHRAQHHWRLDGSEMKTIFSGPSPLSGVDAGELETTERPPAGGPVPMAPERPEEFSPGLTPELMEFMETAAKSLARSGKRPQSKEETLSEPRELFLSELADLYYAEKALEKVLPKLVSEASDRMLKQGFEQHLEQTRQHSTNLEAVFDALGERPKAEACPGIEGIKQEHDKFISEHDTTPHIRDLFLTGAAARAEHYEIAAYTGLVTMSRSLGDTKVTKLLQSNLDDEKEALRKVEAISKRLTANGGNGARSTRTGSGQRTAPRSEPRRRTRR